ncbi:copper homeostasis protein CutC [Lactobacillus sp. ESL0791]|uniref:copper homeostasis protein CutC n=1 Tax=Lactobacillus sp. ESL0791 TaxID=2983234 RepID=UPI0023F8F842|nr:copper homeostasis protein CutC [Lactobacillus sp. ESL0791]MDF7638997.1 copper homeostasis protein CutC [Lactobacillus sp. ESL0791]
MIKEACVGSYAALVQNINAGADRIELNDNLAEGGTTPSYGTIAQSVSYAHQFKVPLVVMIRPRGGDFVYSNDESAIMAADIKTVAKLGAEAVAFGCLTEEGLLDQVKMGKLITLAHSLNLEVVMHMAFDAITQNKQRAALDWLAAHRVIRILTHGGSLQQPIIANLAHIKEIISWADGRIVILPGGGITAANCEQVAKKLRVSQVHGTKIVL